MTLWLVRAGSAGEHERAALQHGVAAGAWAELPDLATCISREELEIRLRAAYPAHKPRAIANWHGQLWALRMGIRQDDLVVMPLKSRPAIAIGHIAGPYRYRKDLPCGPVHTRPVDWLATVPRSAFDTDILLSFGAFMTVCRVARNDAEQRVRALLLPPPEAPPLAAPEPAAIEERSHDLIRDRIARRFKGHALAALVAALLEAQGCKARLSPPGADGGVDILVGSGPLGFDAPRIVVQVKSQDTKLDVRPLRELAGVMARFQAEHGLLVGWGGFNQAVRAEAAADYFRIRLWDAADVVAAVKDLYDRLPHPIRAEIPLRQVWTLAPDPAVAAATLTPLTAAPFAAAASAA